MKKQSSQKKNRFGSSRKGSRFSSRLLLFVLAFALLANAYMIRKVLYTSKAAYYKSASASGEERGSGWESFGNPQDQAGESDNEKVIRISDVSERWGLTDPVDSEEACRQAVRDLGPEIGIDVIRYDYPCVYLDRHHLMDTYTLQQYYRGIPVAGHVLTVAVEKDGKIRSVIGREAQLPDSIDALIDKALSEKEAKALWLKEGGRSGNSLLAEEGVEKKSEGLRIVCSDQEDPGLVYRFRADQKNKEESVLYLVDAVSGKIRSLGSSYDSAMTHVTLQGQTGEKRLAVDQIRPGKVLLQDLKRHIAIYASGMDQEAIAINPTRNSDAGDPIKQSGVDALYNMQRAWQYFARVHGRKGLDGDAGLLRVFLESSSGEHDDGAFLVSNPDGEAHILIGDRKKADLRTSARLDLMGHEYSHGIINQAWRKEFGLSVSMENKILAEGLADLFGELVEDSYDGRGKDSYYDNSCDWVSMAFSSKARDAKEAREGQISSYNDLASARDPHDGTYMIIHPAWLLTQGVDGKEEGKWNNLRLSQLYYEALWSVNGSSNLQDFRFALENSARALLKSGRIDAGQMEAVAAALDQVGIPKVETDSNNDHNVDQKEGTDKPAGGRNICLALEAAGYPAADTGKRALLSYVRSLLEDQPSTRIHVLGLNSSGEWTRKNDDFSLTAVNRAILDGESGEEGQETDLERILSAASACLLTGEDKKEDGQGSQLIILWAGSGQESVQDKTVRLAESLKEKGTDIICLDLTDGARDNGSGLDRIASETSFYPAAGPDAPGLVLSWLFSCQVYPGEICRMTAAGLKELTVYEKGKDLLTYGPGSADMEAAGCGLVWQTRKGAGKEDALVCEYICGNGLEIGLTGGEGTGNLAFQYQDDHGYFSDKREFKGISLGEKTVIYSQLNPDQANVLKIDQDGDGLFERIEEAGKDGKGKKAGHPVTGPVGRLSLCMLAFFLLLTMGPALLRRFLARRKEKTGGPVCLHCGMKNRKGARACRQCGKLLPAPVDGHESKFSREREETRFKPARFIFAGIVLLLTLLCASFSRQPGTSAYMEYAEGHFAAGSYICDQGLDGKRFQKNICRRLINRFAGRLEKDDKVDPNLAEKLEEILKQLGNE